MIAARYKMFIKEGLHLKEGYDNKIPLRIKHPQCTNEWFLKEGLKMITIQSTASHMAYTYNQISCAKVIYLQSKSL